MLNNKQVRIICGTSNKPLGNAIARKLNVPLCDTEIRRFSDGELFVQINDNIRGANVFIVQPTNPPADNLLELLMLIEASRRASAKNITAVIPYFGYAMLEPTARRCPGCASPPNWSPTFWPWPAPTE